VARFAERDGCGIAADPDSPEAVAVAVRGVLGHPERLAHMGRKSRDLALSYDRGKQLQNFVQAIEEARPA
jgi:UDP-N-acetylglucosamine:LPS N-acetylglucosamine transferase